MPDARRPAGPTLKVALVCPTVGQTRRGYERFFTDLHSVLGPDIDVHLFKGAGAAGPRETVVPHVRRSGLMARLLGQRLAYRRYQLEHASFATMLALMPTLRRGHFDIVHVIDPPLAHHLQTLRRLAGLRFRLLYTHGGPAVLDPGAGVDHVHCLTQQAQGQMRDLGVPEERLTVVPVGVHFDRFRAPATRAALRQQWQVPAGRAVVLCVGALNRHHKRIDHLIREMAAAGSDTLLWLDGSLHPDGDTTLLDLGREKLGNRFRYTEVESSQVGELYALADLLVSAAVDESFGMAIVEAMSTGLPALVHDSVHFRALLGAGAHRVDMLAPGALSQALRTLLQALPVQRPMADPQEAVARFSWLALRADYIQLYGRLQTRPPAH